MKKWSGIILLSRDLDALLNAVGLARVDLLAGLVDSFENLFVGKGRLGDYGCELGIEGYVVGFDTFFFFFNNNVSVITRNEGYEKKKRRRGGLRRRRRSEEDDGAK